MCQTFHPYEPDQTLLFPPSLDDWLPERRRVSGTMAILFLNLLMFRFLFDQGSNWVALVFYIWANLFSSILFVQFWLVAGDLFTPREAKQLFGWVGAVVA